MLQGSQDGQDWHTLRSHENDESLTLNLQCSSVANWAVEAGRRRYRHFQLLQQFCTWQHEMNSHDNMQLSCRGIELSGDLFMNC